jgi:protein-tyrosine-phosphatase
MAEKIYLARARDAGVRAIALSMGVMNLNGRPAPPEGIEALAEIGLDLSWHRSQGVLPEILRNASDIFVMGDWHVEQLMLVDRSVAARARLLGELDPTGPREIADPVGQDVVAFRACRDRLIRCIDPLIAEHGAS